MVDYEFDPLSIYPFVFIFVMISFKSWCSFYHSYKNFFHFHYFTYFSFKFY